MGGTDFLINDYERAVEWCGTQYENFGEIIGESSSSVIETLFKLPTYDFNDMKYWKKVIHFFSLE